MLFNFCFHTRRHNMEKIGDIKKLLIKHEGWRNKPYRCPAGKLTIGVGRNLEDRGLSDDEIEHLLENDIKIAVEDLKKIFGEKLWDELSNARKAVLIDMMFNLGYHRFKTFKRMIAAIKRKDFKTAAQEMKNSRWYHQVGHRGAELVWMMFNDKWIEL